MLQSETRRWFLFGSAAFSGLFTVLDPSFLGVAKAVAQPRDQIATCQRIGDEAFRTVQSFFDYDRTVPLDARILSKTETPEYIREKIVFTGGRGDIVPGFLGLPKVGRSPHPIVLQLHAGAMSKDSWWQDDSFERGGQLTRRLMAAGVGVLALDAQFHGERSRNTDYLPFQELYFDKQWFGRIRDLLVESGRDWLRALDYLANRPEVDLNRIGVIGHSLGGIMASHIAALEPRIGTVVCCVGALSDSRFYPLQPVNFASRIRDKRVLLLAGRSDPLVSVADSQCLFAQIQSRSKELEFFDSGHRLPEAYLDRAVSWLLAGLNG
jgi:predicted esterase